MYVCYVINMLSHCHDERHGIAPHRAPVDQSIYIKNPIITRNDEKRQARGKLLKGITNALRIIHDEIKSQVEMR